MKIEFLIQLKKDANAKKNFRYKLKEVLNCCFTNVTKDTFEFTEKNENLYLSYNINQYKITTSDEQGDICFFSVETDMNGRKAARALDIASELLTAKINEGADKFSIMLLYDERSKYFSIKAYPYFCEFETKLRCLVLKILTKSFGVLWAKTTLTPDVKKTLIERLRGSDYNKIAQEAIFEMDYNLLHSFLFAGYRSVQPEDVVDIHLSNDRILDLNINDIKRIVEQARLKSNWERYFEKEVIVPELDIKLEEIREDRNRIAHNKKYVEKDYIKDRSIINCLCKQFDEAIEKIEKQSISEKDSLDILFGFSTINLFTENSYIKNLTSVAEILMESLTKEYNFETIRSNLLTIADGIAKQFAKHNANWSETLVQNLSPYYSINLKQLEEMSKNLGQSLGKKLLLDFDLKSMEELENREKENARLLDEHAIDTKTIQNSEQKQNLMTKGSSKKVVIEKTPRTDQDADLKNKDITPEE